MALFSKKKQNKVFKYTGTRQVMDGRTAVIMCERESIDAVGAYLSSTQTEMSQLWKQQQQQGHLNIADRPLIFVDAEDNQAAATVTAGLSLSGLRATQLSSSAQSVATMHASLYASVGKRLPYLLTINCTATHKATSNRYCSHDDYHSMSDTGFIQFFARDNQAAADLQIIGRKIAELSLNPVAIAQDGILTSHFIEPLQLPERPLIKAFVGLPDDIINTPTPAQSILYGKTRRRVPESWTVDQPMQSGGGQDPDSYMQTVAAQRPYFFDHVADITAQCMDEWYELTGRRYQPINQYLCDDADYLIIAQGSVLTLAEVTVDYLREQHNIPIGVVNITQLRPFADHLISELMKAKKGVLVLERTDQPLASDLPLITEIRSSISKAFDENRYQKRSDIPVLYSGCFGLGGCDIQTKDMVAAVENMLVGGKQQPFFYLGIDFLQTQPLSPQQEIQQQAIIDAYPQIDSMVLKGGKTPDLLPNDVISIRLCSFDHNAINQAGQNLAEILCHQLACDVKAQPATDKTAQFQLIVGASPFKLNCLLNTVDILVISTTHNDVSLQQLKSQGTLIIQTHLSEPHAVWQCFTPENQQLLRDQQIQVFFIDAVKLAHQNSDDLSQQAELQHIVFKSVLFKVSTLHTLFDKTTEQIQSLIDKNQALVHASYEAVQSLQPTEMQLSDVTIISMDQSLAPLLLQQRPHNENAIASIHRFWTQTGHLYRQNHVNNTADPFTALGVVPAASSIFANLSVTRSQHPQWVAENCTACGDCYIACPDTAISGLVNSVNDVFETNIKRQEQIGQTAKYLRRAIRVVERKYHELTVDKSVGTNLEPLFAKAIGDTIKEYPDADREAVNEEFTHFKQAIGSFKFALTEQYHDEANQKMPRSGGLFSITINPDSCKGCMECVTVCETEALTVVEQTTESLQHLNQHWAYWLDLPNSNAKYKRIENLSAKQGILDSLLLDKNNHQSVFNSDNSRAGNGEKIAVHLFTSTVTALMQARVQQHLNTIKQLITQMETHIRLQLAETLDISDIDALEAAIDENQNVDLTLSRLSGALDQHKNTQPIDAEWLRWALQLVAKLKHLQQSYQHGVSGQGRAVMGMTENSHQAINTYPYNPYPFPWSSQLTQDAPSLAMGLFEGQMLKMAEGFKAMRAAELEIKGKYKKSEHDTFFAYFDWHQFSETEYLLCPPLVTLGRESFENSLQSLSHSLNSGVPIKILSLDNHHNEASRKQLSLIAMAHQHSYVQQGSISNTSHLLSGFIDGLNYQGSAVWNIYTAQQPQHGKANNSLMKQSQLALESRAYPLLTFNPQTGATWEECLCLADNPDLDQDWIQYPLAYTDEYGNQFTKDVPLTYADWAFTEVHYQSHFKTVAMDKMDSDELVLLTEYLAMSHAEQADNMPFIWAVHPQSNQLIKVTVADVIVKATQASQAFWQTLKGLSGNNRVEVDTDAIEEQAKAEMAQTITEGLMSMVAGDNTALTQLLANVPAVNAKAVTKPEVKKAEVNSKPSAAKKSVVAEKKAPTNVVAVYEPVWIETPDCTTCDECVDIAPNIFQYNEEKKAIVIDPTKGTFEDIVRSAEKCTAVIIHPGTPWNKDEPNLASLIKRAEKFQ